MIRHLDNFYIPDRKEASMKKFLESATWNVAFHLNPTIPHLDEHGAKKLGEKYLLHVQRHLFGSCPDNHYAKLALLMEYSAQDLWHYHGFGYVTSQKKEKRLLACGKQWFISTVKRFFENGGARAPGYQLHAGNDPERFYDPSWIHPTAIIQPIHDRSSMLNYACKKWEQDGKEDRVLLSGREPKQSII